MLPFAAWLTAHPTLLADMFRNYKVATTPSVGERATLYWDYFNPSYLFFSGGSDPMWATRRAGVFLLPIGVLLPLGIWNIWRLRFSIPRALLLVGFLFAPVPIIAALPEAPRAATARDLLVVPFGILISVAGVEFLVEQQWEGWWRPVSRPAWLTAGRLIAALLILGMPIQFVSYAKDYFGDYQRRSSFRHDYLNVRGVVEAVITRDHSSPVPAVYLNEDLGASKAVQWKFHLITHHRAELWDRTKYFSVPKLNPSEIPRGSVLVMTAGDPRLDDVIRRGPCTVVQVIKDVTDSPSAAILVRH
jgi:hypothetical protein